jgi:hypothetical protein
MRRLPLGSSVLQLVSIVLGTLCLGALWSIFSAISGGLSGVFALLAALAIVGLCAFNGFRASLARALLACGMLLLAMVYQAYLQAAAIVAAQLGTGLYETARSLGFEFAFAVARAQTPLAVQLWYAIALVLALLLGLLWRSPQHWGSARRR